jgi:integrase
MPRSEEVRPASGKNLSLPIQMWPEADRNAWVAACKPATRLRRGGAAGHLKPVTRDDHAADYGNFLGFLDRCGLLGRDGPSTANVMPEHVERYLDELRGRLASTTLHVTICRLRRIARYIAPSRDLAWLAEIGKELKLLARPRSKSDRLVTTEVLVEAGLTLIHEAERSRNMTELGRACQVRNGLMVASLAFCPIRRKNFTALAIGRSFVKIRGTWWIVLSASETKEKRADERPINELLTPVIDRYLGQHRLVLARISTPPSALWLSAKNGTPIGAKQVANLVRMTTLSTVGVAVSPHLFRAAGASSAALLGGENPHLGSALLHHTDPSLTNAHYNRATSLSAAESFRQIVRQYD